MRPQDFLSGKLKDVKFRISLHNELVTTQEEVDSFAIGFAEWLGKGMTCRLNNGNWIYNMELKASTTEELLERYKQENRKVITEIDETKITRKEKK